MALKVLIPVLEAIYTRDQMRLREIQNRIDSLQTQITELTKPAYVPTEAADEFKNLPVREKHISWRQNEAARLTECTSKLDPELESAKADLKISFGKLEVAKKLSDAET